MKKALQNKKIWITVIIFLIIFMMRIPNITNSPVEIGDMWRQADTESIARNFIEDRFNIFYPQFNYDGAPPNYVQLELQVTTFLIAILYKIFGHHYLIARLVPTLFFMGSVYYLFLISKRFYSYKTSWVIIIIYGILPINLFYSRAIMPESALLFFFVGAFYYFIKWIDTEKFGQLMLAGIFTALAISQKIPAIFIGLTMIALCFVKYKWKFIFKKELWIFAVLALLPNVIFFLWSGNIAEAKFVSGIATKHIFPKFFTAFLTIEAITFYKKNLIEFFGWIPIIGSLLGLFTVFNKKERPILFWAFAMILEVLIIVSVIRLEYYLIMLGPIIAILCGKAIAMIWEKYKAGIIITLGLVVLIFFNSKNLLGNSFDEINWRMESSSIIDKYTEKDDLVLIGTFDPSILSLSNRKGWRANLKYYDYIPENMEDELEYFINNGAKYFFIYSNYINGDDGSYVEYLKNNYETKYNENGYTLYKLQ